MWIPARTWLFYVAEVIGFCTVVFLFLYILFLYCVFQKEMHICGKKAFDFHHRCVICVLSVY